MGRALVNYKLNSMGPRGEVTGSSGRYVEVPEIPVTRPVTVKAKGLAAMVIDMQRDFITDSGRLFVGPSAPATVPRIRTVLDLARSMKVAIIYTQDWHPQDAKEFEIWGPHCVENSEGAEIVEELAPLPGDIIVRKRSYDPFFETDLEERLSEFGVDGAIVMGTVSNVCVLHAVAGLALRGVRSFVPVDCISSINKFDEAVAHRQITFLYKGVLTDSEALRIV